MLIVMLVIGALVLLAGGAFLATLSKGKGPNAVQEEPLSADSRTLLRPFDAATRDMESLAKGGGDASLVAAEGLRSLEETRREAYRLVLRRQELAKNRGRSGVATDTYDQEIGRIDGVLEDAKAAVVGMQEEVHRLAAVSGTAAELGSSLGGLRAVLATARELRGQDGEPEVRA